MAYLGTFSKVFSPGVRLGWVRAHPEILRRMRVAKRGTDLGPSSLSQTVAVGFFRGGEWREHVRRLVEIYRERLDAMLDSLAEFMPEEVPSTSRLLIALGVTVIGRLGTVRGIRRGQRWAHKEVQITRCL